MKEEDLSGLNISGHVVDQFKVRYKKRFGFMPVFPRESLEICLRRVMEVGSKPHFIIYRRRRGNCRVRYYMNHEWCFVVDGNRTIIITVYPIPSPKDRRPVKKDRRRYFV